MTRCPLEVPKELFYAQFQAAGLQCGPCFQGVERVWGGEGEALGLIEAHRSLVASLEDYLLHPAILDSAFHVLLGAL